MNKVDQSELAYDMRKAPPNSTQAAHMAQQVNQQLGNPEVSTNFQAVEMITNAGPQQQWVYNSGAVTNLDTEAMTRNSQAPIRNNKAGAYSNTNGGNQYVHANVNNFPSS